MHHFDSCHLNDLTLEQPSLINGWSKIRQIKKPQAKAQLLRIDAAFQNIFFELPLLQRIAAWSALPHTVKLEVNLAIEIFDALRTGTPSLPAIAEHQDNANDAHACIALAKACSMPPNSGFPRPDSAYLLALSNALRQLDRLQPHFFEDRITVWASDIMHFVGHPASGRNGTNTNADFRMQRQYDLAALRFAAGPAQNCNPGPSLPPNLTQMHTLLGVAMVTELRDKAILQRMFQAGDDRTLIYHTGISFHNAAGKDVDSLIDYLDTQADPAFIHLSTSEKQRLVRIKLYRLQESPLYSIGSVKHSMATILMRMSDRPPANRYLHYRNKYHLLECWENRHAQWIEKRDFELSPDLYNAMHMAASNGVHQTSLASYRDVWQTQIMKPIVNAQAVRDATPKELATLWRWLAARSPGWSASSHRWQAITPEQYAAAVTSIVETFYNIQQASDLPHYQLADLFAGVGFHTYHSSLSELTVPLRAAITDIAKAFDFQFLSPEQVLFDDWLTTSYRLLDSAHYRMMLVMHQAPSYSIEIDAYMVLIENGVTHEQMTDISARIICAIDDSPYFRRLRPVHEAFIDIIRNPHSEARLQLPNGKLISPHPIIEQRFERYCNGLSTNSWIIGRARQNLRDRGLPFFPGLLKAEIEALVAPFLKNASKATASGTELADHFFGSMPITSPILKMSRAIRAGNYSDLPYYSLILVRDVMAVVALRSALGAAYLTPAKYAARYGSAAILGLTAASTKRNIGLSHSMKLRKNMREKQRDVPLSGDQSHNLQDKVLRRTNQNNAARHYSARTTHNLTGEKQRHFDMTDWQNMMTLLLPANIQEADRQRQKVTAIMAANDNSLLNITVLENTSEIGNSAGLLGLSQLDADTMCDHQLLSQRSTILTARDWRIKTDSAQPRLSQTLLTRHISVTLGEGVEMAWLTRPSLRYDPLVMLADLYETSQQLRKLLHWHDDHVLENHLIEIHIEMDCHAAQTIRSALWGTVDIILPENSAQLPFIMNEQQIVRQSILQAMLECVVAAITDAAPPPDAMAERGANIWLVNQILLEHGEVFIPRINAASLLTDAPLIPQMQRARANAEQEDQYMERIITEYQVVPFHARFQGAEILKRPTVIEVADCLLRIDYAAYLQSVQATVAADAETRADFKQRFEQRFVIDPASRAALDPLMLDLFLFNCYADSSLFRRLFDYNQSNRRWTIYPAGVYAPGPLQFDILIPRDGIVNANAQDALYMGLTETRTDASGAAIPQTPMQALEPLRRFLDGIVEALNGNSPEAFDTSAHRGATVWISDMVLWQAGMPANKRLARTVVPAIATAEIARLNTLAAANRRAARVEDTFLMMLISEQQAAITAAAT